MAQIGALVSFVASTVMKSADANQNFTDVRTAHNGARIPVAQAHTTATGAGATAYLVLGFAAGLGTEKQTPCPAPLVIDRLTIRTKGAQPGTGTLVFTLRKNGVDTAVQVTVAAGAAAGTYEDTAHSVSFSASDRWSIKVVNNAASASPLYAWTLLAGLRQQAAPVAFAAATKISVEDVLGNFNQWRDNHDTAYLPVMCGMVSAGATYMGWGWGNARATETDVSWVAPVAGTLRNLYVYAGSAPGSDITVTLRKNEADTALTFVIPSASSGSFSDTVHSVSVAAGDRITISAPSTVIEGFSATFDPLATAALPSLQAGETRKAADVNTAFDALKTAHNGTRAPVLTINPGNAGAGGIGPGLTRYIAPSHAGGWFATETDVEVVIAVATTLRNLRARITTAQPAGGSLVLTLRKNGVDTALTVTFAASAAAGTIQADAVNSVAFAVGDRLSLKGVNNDGATSSGGLGSVTLSADL